MFHQSIHRSECWVVLAASRSVYQYHWLYNETILADTSHLSHRHSSLCHTVISPHYHIVTILYCIASIYWESDSYNHLHVIYWILYLVLYIVQSNRLKIISSKYSKAKVMFYIYDTVSLHCSTGGVSGSPRLGCTSVTSSNQDLRYRHPPPSSAPQHSRICFICHSSARPRCCI